MGDGLLSVVLMRLRHVCYVTIPGMNGGHPLLLHQQCFLLTLNLSTNTTTIEGLTPCLMYFSSLQIGDLQGYEAPT